MDDTSPSSTTQSPPAERSAELLRSLQDRARTALSAHRERMGSLEAQLTTQLDSISEALASEHNAETDESLARAQRLQEEFETARAEWQVERDRCVAEISSRQQYLDGQQAELEERARQIVADQNQLESRQQAIDERAIKLNSQEREYRGRRTALDQREQQISAWEQQRGDATGAVEAERAIWNEQRVAWDEEKAALERERGELAAALASHAEQLQAAHQRIEATQADGQSAQEQLQAAHADASAARDELSAARAELEAARAQGESAKEPPELQQKLDAANNDVEQLRGQVSELERRLSDQPTADPTTADELAQLRTERDALAEQVAKLEQQPAEPADADAAQATADLERRVELATEDVRELKKQNAQLTEELAAAESRTATAPAAGGGSSWEVLKQKMLANLEGETDDGDPQRQEERVKIEETIRVTNDVVATRDQEIAELTAKLAERAEQSSPEDDQVRELLDADEVIQEHRQRIAEVEKQIQDKLRTAELELSVERATIARERANLETLRAEVESTRPTDDASQADNSSTGSSSTGNSSTGKRRWLSKLGLGGEEDAG